MIVEYLDKDNLHHAYLIEGAHNEVVPEILDFCKDLNIKTSGNPDFSHISIDNFKIEEAFSLREMSSDKSFSSGKKIFLVCVNSFSLDAQNVLLKMFEEPTENTHFFLVMPDTNILLKTLVSRFYFISPKTVFGEEMKDAEKFIKMSLKDRLDFIKELLPKKDEENTSIEVVEDLVLDSNRSKALKFLNALEFSLHQKSMSKMPFDISYFEHFLKVREFLRMPGSSTKTLMESVALVIPNF